MVPLEENDPGKRSRKLKKQAKSPSKCVRKISKPKPNKISYKKEMVKA